MLTMETERNIYCKHCGADFGPIFFYNKIEHMRGVDCKICNTYNDFDDLYHWLEMKNYDCKDQKLKFMDFMKYDFIVKTFCGKPNYKRIIISPKPYSIILHNEYY